MAHGTFVQGDVVDQVLSFLRSGTSVNLVGLRSSGRSTVLSRVAERLTDEGYAPLQVTGVAALRDRPLSALAVAGVDLPSAPLTPGTLAVAARSLERRLTARPSVVVVDDADDIDPVSAGLVVAVRSRVPVPVVAGTRPTGLRQPVTVPLTAALGSAARVEVPVLGYGAVLQVVHGLLPGPVHRSTTARIATASGGLPGLVVALVESGRRAGTLVRRKGAWVVPGDLWCPALVQSLQPLVADLDDDDLDALTQVALAGTVELRRATALVPWETVARLDDAGLLLSSVAGPEPVLGVFPPLLARYLAHGGSPVRSWHARHDLVPRTGVPVTGGDLGLTLPGLGALPLLDQQFAEYWQAELADRRAGWLADPVPRTALPLVTALHGVGAPERALAEVLARTRPDPADPYSAMVLRNTRVLDIALRHRDPARALTLLEDEPAPVGYRGLDHAVRAHLTVVTRRMPDLADLVPAETDVRFAQDAVRMARIECELAAGRLRDAAARTEGFRPGFAGLVLGVELATGLELVLDGRVAEGTEQALLHLERARERLDSAAVRAHAFVAALGLILRCRLGDAEVLLSQVLALTSRDGFATHFQDGVLVLAADVAALRGDIGHARALATQAEALGAPRGPFPSMWPDAVRAEVEVTAAGSGETLWSLAEERLQAGFPLAAATAAVTAMERSPDRERVRPVMAAAAQTDSALARAQVDYLLALSTDDPDTLAAVAELMRAEDLRLYTIRAAVARAKALRARGAMAEAAAQAQEAWAEAESDGGHAHGLFETLARLVDLSAREREILARIGQGLPSSAVAAGMSLSVRTVDNHIQNALRKVGVDNRVALVMAAQTWARVPVRFDKSVDRPTGSA